MQFIHHVVFGLGVLREMNFVTQPAVELYKSITSQIFKEASETGGIQSTSAWKGLGNIRHWKGVVGLETPDTLADALLQAASGQSGKGQTVNYGELTFFGDMRYSEEGLQVKAILEEAATRLFRSTFHMVADVYEGPAMNHSYHEMIIGHGGCFSIVLLSERQARFPVAGYEPDYHMAQFLATRQALLKKGRIVHALLVKDLSPESLQVLEAFFAETARALKIPVRMDPPASARSYAPRSYDRGRPERGRSDGPRRYPKR